jgi:PAS domain S-box-containing protein
MNELNALDEYTSNLPELERKHLAQGMAEMAAIIRRLRDETSTSSGEANKIQAVRHSAAIDQATNPSHFGKETVQALLDAAEAFAFLALPNGRVTAVNKWIIRKMGKPASELVGNSAFMGLPADVAKLRKKKIQEVFRTKRPLCFEDTYDGMIFLHNLYPIMDQNCDVRQIAVVGSDITGHKQARKDLKESEERYRSFLQNFQGIAYKGNIDWTAIFFHGAVEKITGYVEDDFINGNPAWMEIIHPDDIPRIQESIGKIHDEPNYSTSREYRIICRDGSQRWVCDLIRNICDDSGKPVMVQGTRKRSGKAKTCSGLFSPPRP